MDERLSRVGLAVGLTSAALIGFQIVLMQTLSITHWHHFAYLVVSVALLGFGTIPAVLSLSGLAMASVIPLSQVGPARFEIHLLFSEPVENVRLLVTVLLYLAPFLLGALAIGLIFVTQVERIGYFYGANLIGSAIGGPLAIWLLHLLHPISLSALLGFPLVVAALLAGHRKDLHLLVPVHMVALAGTAFLLGHASPLRPSEYKGLSKALTLPDAKIVYAANNPLGIIEVVESSALRFAPGLSLAYRGEVPGSEAVFVNGDGYGRLVAYSPMDKGHILDHTTQGLPFAISSPDTVLALHCRAGAQITQALGHGARRVDAVEPHPKVIDVVQAFHDRHGYPLIEDERVTFYSQDPRAYLSACRRSYALIELPEIGAFGGGTGLLAMREQYLLTREGVEAALRRVKPDGMLAVTVWVDYPMRNALKVASTLVEALEEGLGREASQHLAAVRSWAAMTFVAKPKPFTEVERAAIRDFCAATQFDIVLLPGSTDSGAKPFHTTRQGEPLRDLGELLFERREDFYRNYAFNVRPATDDRPYFSQFLRWGRLGELRETFGANAFPFLELSSLFVATAFCLITVLSVVLILLPLARTGFGGGRAMGTLVYFSAIGAGSMLIEIVSIQRLILLWGNPLYSAAAVIASMLAGMGLGSFVSGRMTGQQRTLRRQLLVLIVLLAIYFLALCFVVPGLLSQPFAVRAASGIVAILPVGFLLGMPFPLALGIIARSRRQHVPWAWGINGCTAVIGTTGAALLALAGGFVLVMVLAVFCYLLALLAAPG